MGPRQLVSSRGEAPAQPYDVEPDDAGPDEVPPGEAGPDDAPLGEVAGGGAPRGEVVVCIGPGGVGKTTTAAAIALSAARAGRSACVVTIDPARRLADALGVSDVGNEPHTVRGTAEGAGPGLAGERWPGQLWAVMLDAQSTFDDLVSRYATSSGQAAAILSNPLYRNIAGALSGTQEYMAVEKLYELRESGLFDLIVVDTPPAQHALDFMEAPKHLARLLDNRVFRLLMTPTRAGLRALEIGAQLMLRTIAKVAGGQVVSDTVQFFTQFEGMEEGFRARALRADELLHSPRTSFLLVCAPRRDTVDEALYLASQLSLAGVTAKTVVANRCHPSYAEIDQRTAEMLSTTPLAPLVSNLEQLRMVWLKEEEQLGRLGAALPEATLARVPFLAREVADLDALEKVSIFLDEVLGPELDRGPAAGPTHPI